MTAQLTRSGNPSSLHASGRAARRVVEESRETIARALGCRPGEVVFTSGGTESDNLAVKGLFWARRAQDPRRDPHPLDVRRAPRGPRPAALAGRARGRRRRAAARRRAGPPRRRRPARVGRAGPRLASRWSRSCGPTTRWAPSSRSPRWSSIAHAHGIPVHTDAVQAVGQVPVDFAASGVDAMTLTAHKVGGPYGVGALVVRRDLDVTPQLHGGGQERDIRSGTIDTPAIAGFAAAVELAVEHQPERRRAGGGAARRPGPPGPGAGARRAAQRRPATPSPGTGCPATRT